MSPSEDRISLQVNGNQWKALLLNKPYNVTYHTLLEFDIVIDDAVDFTAICLDEDTDATGNECVVLNNIAGQGSNYHQLTTKLEVGVSHRLVIPIGSFMGLGDGETSTVNYLGFIQDNDLSARQEGRSTWSNFRLYDQTLDDAILTIHGENVTLANVQDALSSNAGDNQDSRDHIMSVSSDGRTIMASGNSWKYLTLPAPFTVGPSTMLKFDFTLDEDSEKHAICLLNSAHIKDGRGDCFFTVGAHSINSSEGIVVTPYTAEGMEQTYEIFVGAYFTGEVQYIGFLIDNDVLSTRTLGQRFVATISFVAGAALPPQTGPGTLSQLSSFTSLPASRPGTSMLMSPRWKIFTALSARSSRWMVLMAIAATVTYGNSSDTSTVTVVSPPNVGADVPAVAVCYPCAPAVAASAQRSHPLDGRVGGLFSSGVLSAAAPHFKHR